MTCPIMVQAKIGPGPWEWGCDHRPGIVMEAGQCSTPLRVLSCCLEGHFDFEPVSS